MLLSFTLENWMSFRERVTFSMIASRERQHRERVPVLKTYHTSVLPFAAIYGGNASGKTNFFKAINFVNDFVTQGTQPDANIQVEPNRLDKKADSTPSFFAVEIFVNDTVFEYSFSVTSKVVISEKLVEIHPSSEKIIFLRAEGKIDIDKKYDTDFLRFAFRGTRDNQLFLTNSVSQKVDSFQPIYMWFKNLTLIAPDSRFQPFFRLVNENDPLSKKTAKMLNNLDTGITHLGAEVVDIDTLSLDASILQDIKAKIGDKSAVTLMTSEGKDRFIISRNDGQLIARKLVSFHNRIDGKEVRFNLGQESDGSLRMVDLIPAFLGMSTGEGSRVYIIDEIDRSLHTLLTRQLIETYLSTCSPDSRIQLLITTHDVLLMDQDLLRRDEMWIAERDQTGNSTLIPFSDFQDIRYDKDIRKSYLQGRLGGIPKLLIENTCFNNIDEK